MLLEEAFPHDCVHLHDVCAVYAFTQLCRSYYSDMQSGFLKAPPNTDLFLSLRFIVCGFFTLFVLGLISKLGVFLKYLIGSKLYLRGFNLKSLKFSQEEN